MGDVHIKRVSNGWVVTERSLGMLGVRTDAVYVDELVMLEAVWRCVTNPKVGTKAPWRAMIGERDAQIAELDRRVQSLQDERDEWQALQHTAEFALERARELVADGTDVAAVIDEALRELTGGEPGQ